MQKTLHKYKSVNALKTVEINRRFKQGRGTGFGINYKPYLTVRDVPSKGRAHRLVSSTVNRVHHLLSDLELNTFYIFDWFEEVTDIREQFPIPLNHSMEVCSNLNIKHPSVKGVNQVVTTDFIFDTVKGKRIAVSVKYSDELENERTYEKQLIEKAYWESKGILFKIHTEKQVPKLVVENIKSIHPYLLKFKLLKNQRTEYFELLISFFQKYPASIVHNITAELDNIYNSEMGHHLMIFRHLLAQRAFGYDFNKFTLRDLKAKSVLISENWLSNRIIYVAS